MTPLEDAWDNLFDDPAGYWEHEAEKARHIAKMATDRDVRSIMLETAADYDRFAIQASRKRSRRPWSTIWSVYTRWWTRLVFG